MKGLLLVALCGILAACAGGDHEDLRQWIQENAKDLRGNIPKLPEVKPYEPVAYNGGILLDPFNSGKIEPESKGQLRSGKNGLEPDFEARALRNGLLEKYPLESLKMIGYLDINRRSVAVIQAEQQVRQVKVGEYIGLDFGMVTQISDREVKIRELIEDPAGGWSERGGSLYLQGKEGDKK